MRASIGYKIQFNHLNELSESLRQGVGEIVQAAGQEIAAEAKKNIQESPASGRVYHPASTWDIKTRKAASHRTHQASAPGEPPANDLGFLVNSIEAKMVNDMTSVVTVGMEYGLYLEFGAPRAGIEPRPYLGPAVEQVFPRVRDDLRQLVGTALASKGKVRLIRRSIITKNI